MVIFNNQAFFVWYFLYFSSMKILLTARSTLYTQPGGDTIQITQTAHYLKKLGLEVDVKCAGEPIDHELYDVVHFFNLSRPQDILPHLNRIKKLVITSIYIDYRLPSIFYKSAKQRWLYRALSLHGAEYVKILGRWLTGNEVSPGLRYILRGQKRSIKKVLLKASHMITASQFEQQKIEAHFGTSLPQLHQVNLGTEHMPKVQESPYRKGVLCVGRFEALKNQLSLIKAQNKSGFPLTLVGQAATNQPDYLDACKKEASTEVQFAPFTQGEELASLFSKAKVHALCSFYETTGLVTLEALKNGCQVVVARGSAPEEIFKDHAHICDPASIPSISNAILSAMNDTRDHTAWVEQNFSWEKAAHQLLKIYQQ